MGDPEVIDNGQTVEQKAGDGMVDINGGRALRLKAIPADVIGHCVGNRITHTKFNSLAVVVEQTMVAHIPFR